MEKRKNCWLIPTDKPSRLWHTWELKLGLHPTITNNLIDKKHIYIISKEKIKEGDWALYSNPNNKRTLIVKVTEVTSSYFDYERLTLETRQVPIKWAKKIILTTEIDLIKDGIQAIDDDFLKWFVKNPSCERVEVNIEGYPCMSDGSEITFAQPANLGGSEDIRNNIVSYNKQEHTDTKNFVKAYDKKRYKIIIPKEEPKQTVQEYEQQGLEKYSHELKSKQDYKKMSKKFTEILTNIPDDVLIKYTQQETLEEAAERLYPICIKPIIDKYDDGLTNVIGKEDINEDCKDAFYEGAKWQQEQYKNKYSEEDLRNAYRWGTTVNHGTKEHFNEWFEQFKKK